MEDYLVDEMEFGEDGPEWSEIDYPDNPWSAEEDHEGGYEGGFESWEPSGIVQVHVSAPESIKCKDNQECPICLETFGPQDSRVYCEYSCGKQFHTNCYQAWKPSSCPMCRSQHGCHPVAQNQASLTKKTWSLFKDYRHPSPIWKRR